MNKNLYFLAVLPPEEISEEIHNFKKEAHSLYNSKHALKSPAHITLIPPFWMRQNSETEMQKIISDVDAEMPMFKIELKGFDCFEPNVLYINVKESLSLTECHTVTKETLESYLKQAIKMNHGFHPHITIAFKDLKSAFLEHALAHFTNKNFSASFQFQKIELLKYNGQAWKVLG